MFSFINYIATIITKWVQVLDVNLFPDISVTFIDIIFGCVLLGFIFKLCFGGFKEMERFSDFTLTNSVSKAISNKSRINQINGYIPKHAGNSGGYTPKHAKEVYYPKHEGNGYKAKHAGSRF